MDGEYQIISTIPATADWWLLFEDEEGKRRYHPVAAWAKCADRYCDGRVIVDEENMYPMTDDFHGRLSVPVLTGSRLLYLPGVKFTPVLRNNLPAHYVRDGEQ